MEFNDFLNRLDEGSFDEIKIQPFDINDWDSVLSSFQKYRDDWDKVNETNRTDVDTDEFYIKKYNLDPKTFYDSDGWDITGFNREGKFNESKMRYYAYKKIEGHYVDYDGIDIFGNNIFYCPLNKKGLKKYYPEYDLRKMKVNFGEINIYDNYPKGLIPRECYSEKQFHKDTNDRYNLEVINRRTIEKQQAILKRIEIEQDELYSDKNIVSVFESDHDDPVILYYSPAHEKKGSWVVCDKYTQRRPGEIVYFSSLEDAYEDFEYRICESYKTRKYTPTYLKKVETMVKNGTWKTVYFKYKY